MRLLRAMCTLPLLLLLALPASHAPATVGAQAPDLDGFIRQALADYGVPGAAVAVVHAGETVLLRGYGVRRLGEAAPVDADTVFQLASVSKTFTAAGLASLVEEGKLGWDAPVVDPLPEFALHDPYPTRYATARDLLAHRTGLPAFTGDLLGLLGYDRPEVLRRARFIPPSHSFREQAAYSNVGYFMAGQLAGRAAGYSWDDVVQDRLLTPLGMSRTGTSREARPADGNWAANHAEVDGRLQPIPWDDSDVFAAAGGVVSSAADLVTFVQMHLDGGSVAGRQVLRPATVESLFQPSIVAAPSFTELPPIGTDTGFGYALAWGYYYYHGHRVLEKGGALSGVRTIVVLVPEQRLGVVVLANKNLTLLPEAIRAWVLERYLGAAGRDLQAEIRARQASVDALLAPDPPPANPGPPSLPPAGYAGTYQSEIYGRFTVLPDGDGIRLEAGPAAYPGTLKHVSRDTFALSWPPVAAGSQEITFTVGPDGQASGFDTETLGRFVRLAPAP